MSHISSIKFLHYIIVLQFIKILIYKIKTVLLLPLTYLSADSLLVKLIRGWIKDTVYTSIYRSF